MKRLHLKSTLIALFICFFSVGLTAQIGMHPEIDNTFIETDPIEISYDNLPPFVKEFMYKGYKVMPEDVQKIIKIKDGAFLVKINRPVNVFSINIPLKMAHEKLDFFDVKRDILNERPSKVRQIKKKTQIKKKNTIRMIRPATTPEIAWNDIPLNIREYLIKAMQASESQVYKAFDLGDNTYRIILKRAHTEFVIFEESPYRIAFEHSVTNLLD